MKIVAKCLIMLSFPLFLFLCGASLSEAKPALQAKCGYVMLYWAIPNHYPALIFPSNEGDPAADHEEWTNFYAPDQKGNPVPDVVAECYPHTRLGLKEGEKVDNSGMVPYAIPRTMTKCVLGGVEPNIKGTFWCE